MDWKLMTTGGAARAQMLDSCILTILYWTAGHFFSVDGVAVPHQSPMDLRALGVR